MNEAIKLSMIENDNTATWQFPTEDGLAGNEAFYNKYLKNYLAVMKTGITKTLDGEEYFTLFFLFFILIRVMQNLNILSAFLCSN